MKHNRHNRGSVILLVVGVLTALAMIGCVFIMITWTDRKDASAATDAAPMQPVAQSVLGMITAAMTADLRIDPSATTAGTKDWPFSGPLSATPATDQIDYPKDVVDQLLASTAWEYRLDAAGNRVGNPPIVQWRHMTWLPGIAYPPTVGTLDTQKLNDVDIASTPLYDINLPAGVDAGDPSSLVDTDGDGISDAVLFPTGVFDRRGKQYFAAVRVIDLGAYLNLSVAHRKASNGPVPYPFTVPSHVDLPTLFYPVTQTDSDKIAVALETSVCWGNPPANTLPAFTDNLALRVPRPSVPTGSPAPWYYPLDVSDELALRYGGGGATAAQANTDMWNGRLYGLFTSALPVGTAGRDAFWASRNNLTTASVDRLLTRNLTALPFSPRVVTRDPRVSATLDANGNIIRDASNNPIMEIDPVFMESVRAFVLGALPTNLPNIPAADNTARRERMAAQFAANLVAYRDYQTNPADNLVPVVAFQYTDSTSGTTKWVYGVKPQIVITEAYIRVNMDIGPPAKLDKWFYAVELYNPSSQPKTLGIGDYKLRITRGSPAISTYYDIPGPVTISGGGRVVLHSPANGYTLAAIGIAAGCPTVEMTALDLTSTAVPPVSTDFASIALVRKNTSLPATVTADIDTMIVPVDKVELQSLAPATTTPGETKWDLRRCDTPERCYVAAWPALSDPSVTDNTHKLGAPNGIASDPLKYAVTIDEPTVATPNPISDVGVLANIYLAGPHDDVPFTYVINEDPLTSDFPIPSPSRGRPDLWPTVAGDPQTIVGNWGIQAYPGDLPFADMLLEVFSQLRGDQSSAKKWEVYGRLNINTATRDVIAKLPIVINAQMGMPNTRVSMLQMAEFIVAYRDQRPVLDADTNFTTPLAPLIDYTTTRTGPSGAPPVIGLRSVNTGPGFLSPAEVAIPMAHFYLWAQHDLNGTRTPDQAGKAGGMAWNSVRQINDFYRQISNLITVRSDAMCAYIQVQLGPDPSTTVKRNYVAIIDRSNCSLVTDKPIVRAFAEMKQP